MSSVSSWSSPADVGVQGYRQIAYDPELYREPPHTLVDPPGMHSLSPAAVYWCPQGNDTVYDVRTAMNGEYNGDCEELTQANALTNYNVGLATQVSATGEYIPFDMPAAEEHRIYQGFEGQF